MISYEADGGKITDTSILSFNTQSITMGYHAVTRPEMTNRAIDHRDDAQKRCVAKPTSARRSQRRSQQQVDRDVEARV
jgi:hypothetical protein